MHQKLTAIATTALLASSFVFAPLSAVMAKPISELPSTMTLAAKPDGELLKEMPFSETLPDGTTVEGTVSVTEMAYENGQLLVSGVLEGEYQDGRIINKFTQVFTDVPAELNKSSTKASSCDILFLDLGPIFLDLLGLQIDLSEIVLDVNAVPGSGNLLGNLLCSLTGLLDGGPLSAIQNLINQINNLLG